MTKLISRRTVKAAEAIIGRAVTGEERRRSFVRAAMAGVQQVASQYGATVQGPNEQYGFVIVFGNGDQLHFDTMEL